MNANVTPVNLIIEFLNQAFESRAWHGTTLKGSLRNVDHNLAVRRPKPKQHNIREIAIHTAYWKYTIWRKVAGAEDTSFEYKGTDWPNLPAGLDDKLWKAEKAILTKYHKLLLAGLDRFPAAKLANKPPKSKYDYKHYLLGIGSHDLYHAGQIQLIKRLKKGGKAGT